MSVSLYKATHLAQLQSHIDPETGEVDIESFDAANIALADKQLACAAWCKSQKYELAAMKSAIDDAQAQYKKRVSALESFSEYLKGMMEQAGVTEIKSQDGMFKASIKKCPPSVELDEGAVFDDCYLSPPKPRDASKTLIKAAIDAGIEVIGARVIQRHRLEIK